MHFKYFILEFHNIIIDIREKKKNIANIFSLTTIVKFTELDEFLQELDEDVEGMQSTVFFLQQELRASHATVNGNRPSPADKRTYSGSECSDTPVGKRRRGSVLSLEYNEEEEPLTVANGDAE